MGKVPLAKLAEQIQAVEMGRWSTASPSAAAVPTGIPALDQALPHTGLLRGAVHEWLGPTDAPGAWRPAFSLLIHLARQSLRNDYANRRVVWIGENAWPYARAIIRDASDRALFQRSLFLLPRDYGERVWAMELALRSPGVACVVADASGLDRVALRRLQLSAEAGDALGLLARPGSEATTLSSAVTRWKVTPCACDLQDGVTQRWNVHLLRCKGVQPTTGPREWTIERNHATGAFCLPPPVAHRPPQEAQRTLRTG